MRDGGNGRDGQESAQPGGWSGIAALEGAWSRMARARRGHAPEVPMRQWREDHWVLHALGIGIEPFHAWFGRTDATDFPAFTRWLQETAGDPPADRLARLQTVLAGLPLPPDAQRLIAEVDRMEPVLSGEDLAFWDAQGYVVLHDAVPPDDALPRPGPSGSSSAHSRRIPPPGIPSTTTASWCSSSSTRP